MTTNNTFDTAAWTSHGTSTTRHTLSRDGTRDTAWRPYGWAEHVVSIESPRTVTRHSLRSRRPPVLLFALGGRRVERPLRPMSDKHNGVICCSPLVAATSSRVLCSLSGVRNVSYYTLVRFITLTIIRLSSRNFIFSPFSSVPIVSKAIRLSTVLTGGIHYPQWLAVNCVSRWTVLTIYFKSVTRLIIIVTFFSFVF